MIDKKQLLEDGWLVQYVLGELHENDEVIIEKYVAEDNEIKDYLKNLEKDFEIIGLQNAITPPTVVKAEILKKIKKVKASTIAMSNDATNNYQFYFRIAAGFALFLLASSIWLYSELNQIQMDVIAIKSEKNEINSQLELVKNSLDEISALYAILAHPDTKQFILMGNDLMPEGKVVSFVNDFSKSVIINTERLPNLDEDHDYQMWADVDGEMINMGVIDKEERLLAMNYIDNAESLNITIEPNGGSEHPTVERLVTNIYL